jgi:hypothetical protein
LEVELLDYNIRKALERLAIGLKGDPDDFSVIHKLEQATALVSRLPFGINLWKVQNICFGMVDKVYRGYQARAEPRDEQAGEWQQSFKNIAESLAKRV